MQHACLGARAVMMGPGPRIYALISDIRLTMNVSGSKTYAFISEYALICDMRLITREYGNL